MYALDEQVRRHEVAGLVTKYEGWDFLRAVIDDEGVCRGIVAQDLQSMEIKSFQADAVIMATGALVSSLENQQTLLLIQVQQHLLYINKVHIMRMVSSFKFTQLQFLGTINYV